MSNRVIDLDAARRAREEVNGADPPSITFGGQSFRLPAEMPFDFAALANEGKIVEGVRVLLGDQADAFEALKPSIKDIEVLAEGVSTVYGLDLGKSQASPESSAPAGEPSRPTSPASTTPISA